jgi:hypothetical protein
MLDGEQAVEWSVSGSSLAMEIRLWLYFFTVCMGQSTLCEPVRIFRRFEIGDSFILDKNALLCRASADGSASRMGIPRSSRCLQRRAIAVIVVLVHAPRELRAVTDRLSRAARSILTAFSFVILPPGESRRNFRHSRRAVDFMQPKIDRSSGRYLSVNPDGMKGTLNPRSRAWSRTDSVI